MVSEQVEEAQRLGRLDRIQAALEYLDTLDPDHLSADEYNAIEESIIKLYAINRFSKMMDSVVHPAISSLRASVARTSSLLREAAGHADRVPARSGGLGGNPRGVAGKRHSA